MLKPVLTLQFPLVWSLFFYTDWVMAGTFRSFVLPIYASSPATRQQATPGAVHLSALWHLHRSREKSVLLLSTIVLRYQDLLEMA